MTADSLDFTPVIIIGAGRSGTNILRDTLVRFPEFATWDCDEIDPVWRHGHIAARDDEFDAAMADPAAVAFLRRTFRKAWAKFGHPRFLVEKTCANSLRVPYIHAAFPEARFIFLVRDGVDVVASAGKRWRGEMEIPSLPYYWAKLRHTPLTDIPLYGWRFVRARIDKVLGRSERLAFWGPKYRGMEQDLAQRTLAEVCAAQWAACAGKADAALAALPEGSVIRLRYEDLTANPEAEIGRCLAFLGADATPEAIAAACSSISRKSVGRGRQSLGDQAESLHAIMGPTLARFGYEETSQ